MLEHSHDFFQFRVKGRKDNADSNEGRTTFDRETWVREWVDEKGSPMGFSNPWSAMLSYSKSRFGTPKQGRRPSGRARLELEQLESRDLMAVSSILVGGVLTVTGSPNRETIRVLADPTQGQLVVQDAQGEVGRFASAAVASIAISTGDGGIITVDNAVLQPTTIQAGNGQELIHTGGGTTTVFGGSGPDKIIAGAGPATLIGGTGTNVFYSGAAPDTLVGGPGKNQFFEVKPSDSVTSHAGDQIFAASLPPAPLVPVTQLTQGQVNGLIQRASAADGAGDGIVAVVDRGGRVLGVRVEANVSPLITGNAAALTFAIDGAIAEARTAAFFSNDQAPLTSRTIGNLSQTTITQREVNSSPDVADQNSTLFGPGFVAPIEAGGHFPPGVMFTPEVDLFGIEQTNRDTSVDQINGVPTPLASRFNVPTQFIPGSILAAGDTLAAPDSYGLISGLDPTAQPRGIGTLPGGIPIYTLDASGTPRVAGGIGVFFPGTTGYASAENSSLSADYDPTKPDRSLEAEYAAFAAVGGAPLLGLPVGTVGGVAPVAGVILPLTPSLMRIDLVGVTLNIIGTGGIQGPGRVAAFGATLPQGDPNSGVNEPVNTGAATLAGGTPVPDGWLVTPHAGVGITADQVTQIIQQGIAQASITRAAIRLPLGQSTEQTFAVADSTGAVLGLYRMPDSTVFSIAVAVAKARNVAYYDDPAQLQPVDELPGIAPGVAFTNRTFRYLADPRYPEGIDGSPPGPFSIFNDGGVNTTNGLQIGPPLPASAFQSELGFTAFHPNANFHDPNNPLNQDGVVFFPGSSAVYVNGQIRGGFGASGDGVTQDDVTTFGGIYGYGPPANVTTADEVFFRGVRLPYFNFDRNPEG
jgi:uncharacterized protein GlcG (DUF336 family)